jgi:hypothetical protein
MNKQPHPDSFSRRKFFSVATTSAGVAFLARAGFPAPNGLELPFHSKSAGLTREEGATPLSGATWYSAAETGDGFDCRFKPGTLKGPRFITAEILLDGTSLIMFQLTLQEGEDGRKFKFEFSGLNQCSFRMRLPLSLVDQNRWGIQREGAFLKPRCGGDRVDLSRVDRASFVVLRKGPSVARWCMTPLTACADARKLEKPVLTRGVLLDEMGQSNLHSWPAKTRNLDELKSRLQSQFQDAPSMNWPGSFTRWGGCKAMKLADAAGFFRTHNDGRRWWLVDPDGHAFWSAGLDCIRVDTAAAYAGLETVLAWLPEGQPEYADVFGALRGEGLRNEKSVNYLAANFIRTFGASAWREKWAGIVYGQLKRLRFNTVGNWSEFQYARDAKFPYVRPLDFKGKKVPYVYRDFPDVFDPAFAPDVAEYASQLEGTKNDPALIGYFLMNEPEWGFSSELPAAGMLFTTNGCRARTELAEWLRGKYGTAARLSTAWNMKVRFPQIAGGRWTRVLTAAAQADLKEFSTRMTDVYFKALSEACRKVDPNHLNLGMRWAGVPPHWAVEGMRSFDVFSINCYRQKVPRSVSEEIHSLLKRPIIIGEFHFGALDAGLPSSGIGHLRNQSDRAKAYRAYVEDAAANPACVGTHWFTLYDESALGRFDGENYNIGFLDVCNRPYDELCAAAIATHEALYEIASGAAPPFDEKLEYLPNLY